MHSLDTKFIEPRDPFEKRARIPNPRDESASLTTMNKYPQQRCLVVSRRTAGFGRMYSKGRNDSQFPVRPLLSNIQRAHRRHVFRNSTPPTASNYFVCLSSKKLQDRTISRLQRVPCAQAIDILCSISAKKKDKILQST